MRLRVALRACAVALWALAGWLAVAQAQDGGIPFGVGQGQAGAAQSGAFTPDSLASLWAWYDASTFTTDGSTKDGSNNVTAWVNKEGTAARDLSGVAATPLWTSAAINGLDSIDFENADADGLYRDVAPPSMPFVVYMVVKPESFGSGTEARTNFWAGDKDLDNDQYFRCAWHGVAGSPRAIKDAASTATATGSVTGTAGAVHLLRASFISDTSIEIELDGTGAGTSATSGTPSGADRIAVHYFGDSVPSSAGDGLVAEVVITSAVLSAGDNTSLESYLDSKWVIPGLHVPPITGPSAPFPWPPLLGGAGLALALLSARRPRRRGEVVRFPAIYSERQAA